MTFAQLQALPGAMIHIPFQIVTQNYGVLSSAINLTVAEAQAFTAADFTAQKIALRDAWIASRDNPAAPPVLTDDQNEEEVVDIEDRLEAVFRRLSPARRALLKDALRDRFTSFGED